MSNPSLKQRFECLGAVREIDQVRSGSSENTALIRKRGSEAQVPSAAIALARRGASMLKAKRCLEGFLKDGQAAIHLRTVEDRGALQADLAKAGIGTRFLTADA
ncbi:hypothetical protein [Ruegeria lacuscaerulensis]|uniref:hypothetical protein n=1 Tax=Ruegeria lacuscaerulensis TaxID=55218 RepID=UPI001479A475|nr:hypothetical protein [Ruegeria lacuscaerulensis]